MEIAVKGGKKGRFPLHVACNTKAMVGALAGKYRENP